jgi:hypothetical protein
MTAQEIRQVAAAARRRLERSPDGLDVEVNVGHAQLR